MSSKQNGNIVFTRYLYIKDEVRIALLLSILNKNEDAVFWGLELYYSGFIKELVNLLWQIYYDFFATLNPSYESYLFIQSKELLNNLVNDKFSKVLIIASIINDFVYRPFNTDIFFIRNICVQFQIDDNDIDSMENKDYNLNKLHQCFTFWIENRNIRSLSYWILETNKNKFELQEVYSMALSIFEKKMPINKSELEDQFKSAMENEYNKSIILLSKIIGLFSKKSELIKEKCLYIDIEKDELTKYNKKHCKSKHLLNKVYRCHIDEYNMLALFKLSRHAIDLKSAFHYDWEYYASFSPLWASRIKKYGGQVDHINKKVVFQEEPDDDLMQEFYAKFGLEPDEQAQNVQDKNIPDINTWIHWQDFYTKFRMNGLLEVFEEELEEFDVDKLKY